MQTSTEAKCSSVLSLDVELLRMRIDHWITIRSRQHDEYCITVSYLDPQQYHSERGNGVYSESADQSAAPL